ncbi:fibroblast growth factor receptor 1-A-like [Halichoeres trimaculatus]|uniref:fibroblast growth factor receptor 1-A-like n=1 Tax=Halichoeres trimaculatus TaxID=147232 RepID=UPI003D9F2142
MSSQHHVLLVLSYVLLVLLVKATGTQSTEETDSVFAPQWVNPQQMETGLLTVRVSLSVKFTCQATGNPIPTLHWFKNGEKIMMDQRPGEFKMGDSSWMLIMDFVVPSDRGNYTCVLENKHGRLEHTYHLDVVEFPHDSLILEEGLPANQTADVGSEVSFECEVKGNFPTELHWLKQAKFNNRSTASDGSPYVNVLKFQSIIGGLNVLTLRNITTEDAGKYICLAKNSKGASFNTAWLTVINGTQG